MNHKITTTWQGNMLFESDNPNGHKFVMDTSPEHGGDNKGLSPKAMMLSALAGCSGLDVISILDKMKVKLDKFYIVVTGELTNEHPKYYHTVTVDYHCFGNNLNEKKIEKAVNLSIEKYCGVMEMFRQFSKIHTTIYYNK